jgi:hypothetical protein
MFSTRLHQNLKLTNCCLASLHWAVLGPLCVPHSKAARASRLGLGSPLKLFKNPSLTLLAWPPAVALVQGHKADGVIPEMRLVVAISRRWHLNLNAFILLAPPIRCVGYVHVVLDVMPSCVRQCNLVAAWQVSDFVRSTFAFKWGFPRRGTVPIVFAALVNQI